MPKKRFYGSPKLPERRWVLKQRVDLVVLASCKDADDWKNSICGVECRSGVLGGWDLDGGMRKRAVDDCH